MSPDALRRDAPRELALARERELQRCRERLNERRTFERDKVFYRPWTGEDVAALEWAQALAAAGHHGAERVVERVVHDPKILEQLHQIAPEKLHALAMRWPRVASFLARKTFDWDLMQRYLAVGELPDPQRAAEMRQLSAVLPTDIDALRADLAVKAWHREPGQLLLVCAHARSGSEARALIERALALGSHKARERLFELDFGAAPDKAAFLQQWIDAGRPIAGAAAGACMALGVALERREDRDAATRWYERALGKSAQSKSFAGFVAIALDRRFRNSLLADDELAMRWYQRSLELGDDDSMDIWLRACAAGEMGLAADPQNALERVRRFVASGVDLKARRWRIAGGIRAVRAAAEAEKDPALAARWREVAALLEED